MLTFFKRCRSFSTKARARAARGFTLIELLVVVTVITIITAFLLFNQNKFNSSTLLRSLAYSVALSMRQAQAYGVSVRGFGTTNTVFAAGYGLNFLSSDTSHYYLYADANGDGARAGDNSEDLPAYNLGRGYTIKDFCARLISDGSQTCASTGGITSLSVYYRRPNTEACISTSAQPDVCATGSTPQYTDASVTLTSQNGDTRTIFVTWAGQITVGALNVTLPGSQPPAPPPPVTTCTPNWQCTPWSGCSGGTQTRICDDQNSCGTAYGEPDVSEPCATELTCSSAIEGSVTSPGSAEFVADGGTGTYTWTDVSVPQLCPTGETTGTTYFSGSCTGSGTETLQVRDSNRATSQCSVSVNAAAPYINSYSPTTGVNTAAVLLDILGGNFWGAPIAQLMFGNNVINCTNQSVTSGEIQTSCDLTGMPSGSYNLVVTNPDSQSVTADTSFTVTNAPTVNSISPSSGATNSTVSSITIGTSNFSGGTVTVKLKKSGSTDITCSGFTYNSGTGNLTGGSCNLTGATVGSWNVSVVMGAQSATKTGAFSVTAAPTYRYAFFTSTATCVSGSTCISTSTLPGWVNTSRINSIECIGAGGNSTSAAGGGGGGGGAYAIINNPAASFPFTNKAGSPTGDTGSGTGHTSNSWVKNSGGTALIVCAGGGSSSTGTGGTRGLASNSTGTTKFDGGTGGTATSQGGGGGGAAGPNGAGGSGGAGSNSISGAGGGGADGGTAGSTNVTGGTGANSGGNGGAGENDNTFAQSTAGGNGTEWDSTHGAGGGGGGAAEDFSTGGAGGRYGGGAGGDFSGAGTTGGQGIIVIKYTP